MNDPKQIIIKDIAAHNIHSNIPNFFEPIEHDRGLACPSTFRQLGRIILIVHRCLLDDKFEDSAPSDIDHPSVAGWTINRTATDSAFILDIVPLKGFITGAQTYNRYMYAQIYKNYNGRVDYQSHLMPGHGVFISVTNALHYAYENNMIPLLFDCVNEPEQSSIEAAAQFYLTLLK